MVWHVWNGEARQECVKAQGGRQSARVLCGHSVECCTCMAWLVNGGRACLQDGACIVSHCVCRYSGVCWIHSLHAHGAAP